MTQYGTITSTRHHTRYCSFPLSLTWLSYNAIRYHNFNVLPHALQYIFSKFSMFEAICNALPGVTVKFMVTHMATRVVTCSSYGNMLH